MRGLTVSLLERACQTFLRHAYPGGPHTVPPPKDRYLSADPSATLDSFLGPPVCETLRARGGGVRGYAFRLGCANFPHLKLQVTEQEPGPVFAVDTHDQIPLAPDHPEAERWRQLQQDNRRLKEQIERDWEAEGLLTLNALLRRELDRTANPPTPSP